MQQKQIVINEIRYAQRLCERTARLYRRIQTMGNFATIVGSGALASVLAPNVPQWVAITGACVLAVFGAATLAIRPADKAAANETDLRRYSRLLTEASRMEADELTEALAKAKEGNAPEIEPLRRVVYNDVVREIGRDDEAFELSFHEKLIAALA